ncbi:MAG: VCBS repeat-containing protein [Verrucomicrobia bacterium]|nr:VCBS repeat-containing protein [Verrucomicrobiota bacterium]
MYYTEGYSPGTVVTLTAENQGTNVFAAWTGSVSSLSNQIHVTMNGNKSAIALFNNTGDFILQKTNGQLAVWFMQHTEQVAAAMLNNEVALGSNWRVAGTGDFDNNGSKDLLFRGLNGKAALWLMDGNHRIGSVAIRDGFALSSLWRLAAVGDFNSDNSPDLLWQNKTKGKLHIWYMNGTTYDSNATLAYTVGSSWRVVAVADLDGNNSSDIIFQHTTGKVAVWLMDGETRTGSIGLRDGLAPKPGWHVVGARDMDGDGHTDIVFQQDNGRLMVWFFEGTAFNRAELINKVSDPGWYLRALK